MQLSLSCNLVSFNFLVTGCSYRPSSLLSKILTVLGNGDSEQNPPGGGYKDPRFKRVLWYLIGSTKGGVNRAKILDLLKGRPSNANQIATGLQIDYKTVLHHLRVLGDNGLVITENKESYGAVYFLTPLMENNYEFFVEILTRINKSGTRRSEVG